MSTLSPNDLCPCESGKKYKKCCRPYHVGVTVPNPEALVRARFSAYVIADVDFLIKTTHPTSPSYNTQTARWKSHLEAYCLRNAYTHLAIFSADGDQVTYHATIVDLENRWNTYRESCTFVQENGRWLYVDGVIEPVPSA